MISARPGPPMRARLGVVLALAAVVAAPARAQGPPVGTASAGAGGVILDVPYVSQEPLLCGAAAVVMALRYWESRGVGVADFASLVDPAAGGIRTDLLRDRVRSLGWSARAFAGTDSLLREQLRKGRPLVLLLDPGGRTLHYVLAVGFDGPTLFVHDPATRAYEAHSFQEILPRWERAGRWTMLVLPPSDPASGTAVAELRASPGPARPDSDDAASTSAADVAARLLVEGRGAEALPWARAAVRAEPEDRYGWLVLGAALYVTDRRTEALEVWNFMGRPELDRVEVDGLRRTRARVVVRQLGLPPSGALTPARLATAARRLSALPAAERTRLSWSPLAGGRAEVRAAVLERNALPAGWVGLTGVGARAAVDREARLDVGSLFGAGERWTAGWRWWPDRPRVEVGLEAPVAPFGLAAVASVSGAWERQAYAGPDSSVDVVEGEHARLGAARWLSDRFRLGADVGLHRWEPSGDFVSAGGTAELRSGGDLFALRVRAESWTGLGARSAVTGDLRAAWRTPELPGGLGLRVAAGATAASASAPSALWPGAGLRPHRGALLRAHPLLVDGVIAGPAFGRRLVHASLEATAPLATVGPLRLGTAAFVDAVAAGARPAAPGSWTGADAGLGLRLGVDGWPGDVRIDAAVGLGDGDFAVSMAWRAAWPDWP